MKIKYNRLFKKLKTEQIRHCDYFRCMPEEIIEFIPETNYPEPYTNKLYHSAGREMPHGFFTDCNFYAI